MTTAWPTFNMRNVYEFAVGHNVSAIARVDDANQCRTVRTAWVPKAQVERVEPAKLDRDHARHGERWPALVLVRSSPCRTDRPGGSIRSLDRRPRTRPAANPASCESR